MNFLKKTVAFIIIFAMIQIPYICFSTETDLEAAENLMLTAEQKKTQASLNTAIEAIDLLAESKEKWDLYNRADVLQSYISENVAGACHYNFSSVGTVIITEKSEGDTTSGYSAGGKVAEVDGENVLQMIYTGLGGEGLGLGRPNIYKDVSWNNSIDGIAKITMSFNIKSSTNPYYQMWFRYFSMLGTSDMFYVSGNGITCRNNESDVLVFGESEGFQMGKWYEITILFNTTKSEKEDISPMSYKIYVGERGQKHLQYGSEFVMQDPNGAGTDYTKAPENNLRSRLRFASATKTEAGACEILVGGLDVQQLNPFTVTESEILYNEKNVSIELDKISLSMSEKIDGDKTKIVVSDSNEKTVNISKDIVDNKINILFNERLKANESYIIDLSGVKDIFGRTYGRMNIPFEAQKAYLDIDIAKSPSVLCEGETKEPVVYGILPDEKELLANTSIIVESDNPDIIDVQEQTYTAKSRGVTSLKYSFTNAEGQTFERKMTVTSCFKIAEQNRYEDIVSEGYEIFEGTGSLALLDGETKTLTTVKDGDVADFWFYQKEGTELSLTANEKKYSISANIDEWNQVTIVNYDLDKSKIFVNGTAVLDWEVIDNAEIKVSVTGGAAYIDNVTVCDCFESKPSTHSVTVTGTPKTGYVLYGGYVYVSSDGAKEENSEYGWIVNGSKRSKGSNTLSVSSGMEGERVAFYVIPKNQYGISGEQVTSDYVTIASIQKPSYSGGGGGGGGGGTASVIQKNPVLNEEQQQPEQTTNETQNKILEISTKFTDTKGHWAEDTIQFMADVDLIQGRSEGEFCPDENVTRAEFIVLVLRTLKKLGIEKQEEIVDKFFVDVQPDMWFYNDVLFAAKCGLVKGDGENMYPERPISRQEMAVILSSVVTLDYEFGGTYFSDYNQIDLWAEEAVGKCNKLGLMQGDNGYFRPHNKATRAEAATVLKKLMDINE